MKYLEYKPTKSLAKYIQLIWISESEASDDHYPKEKILPDGIVEIIFHFKGTFFIHDCKGKKMKQPKGFAVSQMRNFIEIESNEASGFVSVRFYPWGAHHFFNYPIGNFIDSTIDIKKLWEDDYQLILKNIKTVSNDQKVTIIQEYLSDCLIKYKKNCNIIDDAIKLIRKTKGKHSIEQICNKSNLTYKQLERKFLVTIGTTPKIFSRTTRFLHLCHHLKKYEDKNMAQLTYELGYYDQAHIIKDFRAFTGLTPKEYYEHNNICFADF